MTEKGACLPMEQPTIAVCPLCGAALSDETVCPRCGQPVTWEKDSAASPPLKRKRRWLPFLATALSVGLLGFVIAIPAYRTYLSRQASPETLVDNWNTALRQEDLDLFFSLFGEHFDPTEDYWLSLLEQPVYLELLDYQIGDHGKMAKLRVRVSAGREEVYSTVSYMFAVREEGKWVFSLLYM